MLNKFVIAVVIAFVAFTVGFSLGKAKQPDLSGVYAPQETGWETGISGDSHRRVFCGVELSDGRHVTWFEEGHECHSLYERKP